MAFPTANLIDGYIREHSDGRRWEWSALKGVWKIKQTISTEDNYKGESAYETAVRLGFSGTETEWVASLTGSDGAAAVGSYSTTASQGNYKSEGGILYMYLDGAWKQLYPAVYS